jgi:hypothetical protein
MRRLLCLALLVCALGRLPVADAQDSPGFFVEIEPARSTKPMPAGPSSGKVGRCPTR